MLKRPSVTDRMNRLLHSLSTYSSPKHRGFSLLCTQLIIDRDPLRADAFDHSLEGDLVLPNRRRCRAPFVIAACRFELSNQTVVFIRRLRGERFSCWRLRGREANLGAVALRWRDLPIVFAWTVGNSHRGSWLRRSGGFVLRLGDGLLNNVEYAIRSHAARFEQFADFVFRHRPGR